MYRPQVSALFKATTEVRKGAPLGNDNAKGPHAPFTRGGTTGNGTRGGVVHSPAVGKTIQLLGKTLDVSDPKQGAYSHGARRGQAIEGVSSVATKSTPQQVFDALKDIGFSKGRGHDPSPGKFTMSRDTDSMTAVSDRLHNSQTRVSAHIQTEHGSTPRIHFEQH